MQTSVRYCHVKAAITKLKNTMIFFHLVELVVEQKAFITIIIASARG